MSPTSAYFIPVIKFPVGQFKTQTKKVLEELAIIDGYYDEENELYAAYKRIAFEYASIHDTGQDKLIPEASTEGYGATCNNCAADIDEQLYDTINDYYDFESDTGEEKDMKTLLLTCPECNTTIALGDVKFSQPALFANQFFQLVAVNEKIEPGLIKELQSELGCEIKVIYEIM